MLTALLLTAIHSSPLRDCSAQRPCYITAYKDAEEAVGTVRDFFCRDHTYDRHQGTDFGIGGFAEMDRGRPVFATAPGTVAAAQDGNDDRCTSGRCAGGGGFGNFVVIDHGGGETSRFAHLRRGSIAVQVGDTVVCGGRIAEVGSSGYSTGPHLHFELQRSGRAIEAFAGDCGADRSAWRHQGGYRELPAARCSDNPERDDSQFVDENLVDGSEVAAGSNFEKRWVLRNVGTRSWDETVVAMRDGDGVWGAPEQIVLAAETAPGEELVVRIELVAGDQAGEHAFTAYQLSRDGVVFGTRFWFDLRSRSRVEAGPADAGSDVAFVADDAGIGSDADSFANVPPSDGCACSGAEAPGLALLALFGLCRRRGRGRKVLQG
jgi:murein DD-endopeptidase MepM/ murein hydrolase activator NlpD